MVYLHEIALPEYKSLTGSLGYVSLGIGVVLGILVVAAVIYTVPAGACAGHGVFWGLGWLGVRFWGFAGVLVVAAVIICTQCLQVRRGMQGFGFVRLGFWEAYCWWRLSSLHSACGCVVVTPTSGGQLPQKQINNTPQVSDCNPLGEGLKCLDCQCPGCVFNTVCCVLSRGLLDPALSTTLTHSLTAAGAAPACCCCCWPCRCNAGVGLACALPACRHHPCGSNHPEVQHA